MKPRWMRQRRPDLDREAERYYLYWCYDADGRCLYIGRSCDPLARLRSHHGSRATWPAAVVQIEGTGPFTWDEACRRERAAITAERPLHNKEFVTRKTAPPVRLTA